VEQLLASETANLDGYVTEYNSYKHHSKRPFNTNTNKGYTDFLVNFKLEMLAI